MSDNTISRKAAIEAVKDALDPNIVSFIKAKMALEALPPSQPKKRTEERTETHACDCISRKASIDADGLDEEIRCGMCKNPMRTDRGCDGNCKYDEILYEKIIQILNKRITQLPSAQPEQTNSWYINSWCNNCKEYDTENKCCPRYNRVIKQTLDEVYAHAETEAEARYHAQQRWIPCSERLPEEGRYVLCSQSNGDVGEGKLLQDSCGEWLILYDNLIVDDGEVIAWMPLPEPYAERRTDG